MKSIALVSTLFLWLVGMLYITLAHGDLFKYGRTESFSLILHTLFIITTALLIWTSRKEIKKKRIRYLVGFTIWTGIAFLFGIHCHLLAFGGVPSDQTISELAKKKGITDGNIVKILHGPALSATTEYQKDVYRWNTYFGLLITRNEKTEPVARVNG